MECRRKEVWPHYWDTNYSLIRRHKIAISPVRRPAIDVRLVVGQAWTCATSIMGQAYGGVSTIPPNVMDTMSLSNTAILELRQTTVRRQSVACYMLKTICCWSCAQTLPSWQSAGSWSSANR